VDPNLHIPRYDDFNLGGVAIDTVAALLGRALDTPVMGGSATIDAYNLNEATDILFGPPGAAHRGGIKRQIRDAFGLAWTDFIEVPVLFNLDGGAVAITPGLANGAVYPGVYIAPEVFLRHNTLPAAGEEDANANFRLDVGEDANANGRLDTLRDPFHVFLNARLPAGLVATYIDDWEVYHLREGEVHCSSNERREIPVQNWWE
jgi:protein-arginine deiminase